LSGLTSFDSDPTWSKSVLGFCPLCLRQHKATCSTPFITRGTASASGGGGGGAAGCFINTAVHGSHQSVGVCSRFVLNLFSPFRKLTIQGNFPAADSDDSSHTTPILHCPSTPVKMTSLLLGRELITLESDLRWEAKICISLARPYKKMGFWY
jgi:hypothetical protein